MERYGNLEFATKKELFKFLSENRDKLIAQKKAVKKEVDCSVFIEPKVVKDAKVIKAANVATNANSLKVICIINTTNFLDGHGDVHLPGIWNKTLQENKMIMHLQEHDMEFDKIISDGPDLKAYTKKYSWAELGYDFQGETEALVFESNILKMRNEFMFNQYANGWVKNHSVGMYYVKMDMAVNDEEAPTYYDAWKKYYPQIVNKEEADRLGYFFYVLEAKCIEGSAVPKGSNTITPTLSVGKGMVTCPSCGHEFDYNSMPESGMGYVNCPKCSKPVSQKDEPLQGTHKQDRAGDKSTQINYEFLIKNLKKN